MDENKVGFAIPPKAEGPMEGPMEGPAEGIGADFIQTFSNGEEARNFVCVATDADGEFVEKLDPVQLEEYAMGVLDGDEDISNLQVGEVFASEEEAKAEADKLNAKFAPAPDASDEELAAAAVDAQGAQLAEDVEDEIEDEEELPPLFGSKSYQEENKKLGEALDEDEPILEQMKKAGGEF